MMVRSLWRIKRRGTYPCMMLGTSLLWCWGWERPGLWLVLIPFVSSTSAFVVLNLPTLGRLWLESLLWSKAREQSPPFSSFEAFVSPNSGGWRISGFLWKLFEFLAMNVWPAVEKSGPAFGFCCRAALGNLTPVGSVRVAICLRPV